jgi:hypothetical protein
LKKVPSASARWYYDDDDVIKSREVDYPIPLLLLVTTRLGLQGIEPEYYEAIKNCFNMDQCVGILGGKPNFALYFVGVDDNQLIFLDPHFV